MATSDASRIAQAIDSVLAQTYAEFELIVVDDGSAPTTVDPRVCHKAIPEGQGCANLCEGLGARGRLVVLLSSEDTLHREHFASLLSSLEQHPAAAYAYAKYGHRDSPAAAFAHPGWLPFSHGARVAELADLLQFGCYVAFPAAMFRRELFDRFALAADHADSEGSFILAMAAAGVVAAFVDRALAVVGSERASSLAVARDEGAARAQLLQQLARFERFVTVENQGGLRGYARPLTRALEAAVDAVSTVASPASAAFLQSVMPRVTSVAGAIAALCRDSSDQTPRVSVIIRTKNRPAMLPVAIESVRAQTFADWEIVVVNDGGVDVAPIVDPLNERGNIIQVRHPESRGISAALNTGLATARGRYIAYLDDDDVFYPDHLWVLVNFLETSRYRIAYTGSVKGIQLKSGDRYITTRREPAYGFAFSPERLLVNNFIPILCFLQERACLDEVGPFDLDLHAHEDWEMWLRLSRRFEFHYIDRVTCEFTWRLDESNVTFQRQEAFLSSTRAIYARYEEPVRNRPDLLAARRSFLTSLEAHARAALRGGPVSPQALIASVLERFELNDRAGALSYYDSYRAHFTNATPELAEFDQLVRILRGTVK